MQKLHAETFCTFLLFYNFYLYKNIPNGNLINFSLKYTNYNSLRIQVLLSKDCVIPFSLFHSLKILLPFIVIKLIKKGASWTIMQQNFSKKSQINLLFQNKYFCLDGFYHKKIIVWWRKKKSNLVFSEYYYYFF